MRIRKNGGPSSRGLSRASPRKNLGGSTRSSGGWTQKARKTCLSSARMLSIAPCGKRVRCFEPWREWIKESLHEGATCWALHSNHSCTCGLTSEVSSKLFTPNFSKHWKESQSPG